MRVLVCGSRTFTDGVGFDLIGTLMEGLCANYHRFGDPVMVLHGAARGADSLAAQAADAAQLTVVPFPADWDAHGKAAGPIRNQQMLDEGKPDLVLAFVDKPLADSKGTADMVRRARQAGVPTYVIEALP